MIHIKENVPLLPFTTFEIGGSARYFVEVKNEGEIREALLWAREKSVPFVIIAGGYRRAQRGSINPVRE